MKVRKRLAIRVRELRYFRGWSQEGLADIAGMHRSYIGGIERAERNISLDNLVRLARAFGMTPSELLNESSGSSPFH